MTTFIKLPFPTADIGTLVNTYSVKTVVKTSATVITIHFDDSTTMACTVTSDSTNATLDSFNDALETSRSSKSNGPGASTLVVLPGESAISAVAVAVLA